MSNIRGIHKIMMGMAWEVAKSLPQEYYIQNGHPVPKGKGHAAAIKRQAKKRRNKK